MSIIQFLLIHNQMRLTRYLLIKVIKKMQKSMYFKVMKTLLMKCRFFKKKLVASKKAYDYLAMRDGLKLLNSASLIASQKIVVPARMQRITKQDLTFVFDGAHNQQKMAAFIASIKITIQAKKLILFWQLKKTKTIEKLSKKLKLSLIVLSVLALNQCKISRLNQLNQY